MKKFALLAIIAATAAMSSGCSVMPTARKILGKPLNVAGIVERYPSGEHPWKPFQTFNPVPAGTLQTRTDELWYRRNFSGTETKVLWGLFTLTDY